MEKNKMIGADYHAFKPIIASTAKMVGKNISIGPFSQIEDYVLLDSGFSVDSKLMIGSRSKIKRGATLHTYDGWIRIGNRVSIGEYSIIAGHGGINIGDCTIIAGHCYISAANHIFVERKTTRFQGETSFGIEIGENVWIGGTVTITDGVNIGSGCVIGAGSVVTHNLPPYSLCYGIPCKVVKLRDEYENYYQEF